MEFWRSLAWVCTSRPQWGGVRLHSKLASKSLNRNLKPLGRPDTSSVQTIRPKWTTAARWSSLARPTSMSELIHEEQWFKLQSGMHTKSFLNQCPLQRRFTWSTSRPVQQSISPRSCFLPEDKRLLQHITQHQLRYHIRPKGFCGIYAGSRRRVKLSQKAVSFWAVTGTLARGNPANLASTAIKCL